MAKKPKPRRDVLEPLKFKGYCWAFTPPGEDTSFEDFVNFAKFTLCRKCNRLWKDPIWEAYTDEEVLIEYFAHLFSTDEVRRKEFESKLATEAGDYEDIYDWLDRKVAENQAENAAKVAAQPDSIVFEPGKNKDVEE